MQSQYRRIYDYAFYNRSGQVIMPIEIITGRKISEKTSREPINNKLTGFGYYSEAIDWALNNNIPWVMIVTRLQVDIIRLIRPLSEEHFHSFPTNPILSYYLQNVPNADRKMVDPDYFETVITYWLIGLAKQVDTNLPLLNNIREIGLLDQINGGYIQTEPRV